VGVTWDGGEREGRALAVSARVVGCGGKAGAQRGRC
jgi:hypothetical protein